MASIDEVCARTAADYITVYQVTVTVTCDIATATVADGCLHIDRDATLDT